MKDTNERVNVSMSKELKAKADKRADYLFASNFSAYVSYLIVKDLEQTSIPTPTETKISTGKITASGGSKQKVKQKIKKNRHIDFHQLVFNFYIR